jgi:uncharacterized membrane protein
MRISKQRIEAFSDGVIAIIVTIMVLDIPVPSTFAVEDILELLKSIFIFFVSFFIVASQWNKHGYIFDCADEITNTIVWRNLLFLFLLSLLPIFTKWIIEYPDEVVPVVGYDIIFVLVTISFHLLWNSIIGSNKELYNKMKNNRKESKFAWLNFLIMPLVIIVLIIVSLHFPRISMLFFIGIPLITSLLNIIFEGIHNDNRRWK